MGFSFKNEKDFFIGTMIAIIIGGSNFFFLWAKADAATLNLNKPDVKVSLTLYGLMIEEINHSYDGGLYGELIQNRILEQ